MRYLFVLFAYFMPLVALAEPSDTIPLVQPAPSGIKPKKEESSPLPKPTAGAPYIASLDSYGSPKINEKTIRKALGKELDEWLRKGVTGDPSAEEMQKRITAKLKKRFQVPFLQWSIMQYVQPGDLAIRVTLDVVEKKDVKKRMPFLAKRKETLPDPEGLTQQWKAYQDMALKLAQTQALEGYKVECPQAFHCLFGHSHPKLKKYGSLFSKGVNKHKTGLTNILKKDKDGDKRAAAAFLLAYLKKGEDVVRLMTESIRDPDPLVRNNVLRVLGDIAELHPRIKIPSQPIIEALDFPLVTDRSKAVFILYALAESSEAGKKAATQASPVLAKLLRTEQPNQASVAYAILRNISGKKYLATDYLKWDKWAQNKTQKPKPVIQRPLGSQKQ